MRAFPRATLAVGFALTWVACVGEDPGAGDEGHAVGDRLGACFSDGKCKEGLVCRDGEICLTPDEPRPAGDGGNRRSDGGAQGPCRAAAAGPGPSCGVNGPCEAGRACCSAPGSKSAACTEPPSCPQQAPQWRCENNAQCGGTAKCCFNGAGVPGAVCGAAFENVGSRCIPPEGCVGAFKQACDVAGDCSSGKCSPKEMRTALGFTVIVNACE